MTAGLRVGYSHLPNFGNAIASGAILSRNAYGTLL